MKIFQDQFTKDISAAIAEAIAEPLVNAQISDLTDALDRPSMHESDLVSLFKAKKLVATSVVLKHIDARMPPFVLEIVPGDARPADPILGGTTTGTGSRDPQSDAGAAPHMTCPNCNHKFLLVPAP